MKQPQLSPRGEEPRHAPAPRLQGPIQEVPVRRRRCARPDRIRHGAGPGGTRDDHHGREESGDSREDPPPPPQGLSSGSMNSAATVMT